MDTTAVYDQLPAIIEATELEGTVIAPICSIGADFYYVEVGHLGFRPGEAVRLGMGTEWFGVPVYVGLGLRIFVALRRGRRISFAFEHTVRVRHERFLLAPEGAAA